jgi:hypothetical protein
VLIVDEAQNLSMRAVEELRMLSNFQLGSHPLVQCLVLGQPEFRRTLAHHPGLEQLRQRIIASHLLEALDEQEVEAYVRHRLGRVGWDAHPVLATGCSASPARSCEVAPTCTWASISPGSTARPPASISRSTSPTAIGSGVTAATRSPSITSVVPGRSVPAWLSNRFALRTTTRAMGGLTLV